MKKQNPISTKVEEIAQEKEAKESAYFEALKTSPDDEIISVIQYISGHDWDTCRIILNNFRRNK
jgi:hypothetical protein